MNNYIVEIGENRNASICPCCGRASRIGHGFVFKYGDAHAVYYAAWSEAHPEKRVSLALAIGEWGDESTNKDRICFGLEVWEGTEEILFRVIDPEESPWPETDLMGKMISRDEALTHQLLKEVFVIVEEVLRSHSAIREYLEIPSEA